jgi:nicotinate-nucleotide adenylyltransferase
MRQIALLGGTFDPPTLGHIAVAELAKTALGLDEVWLVPSLGTHKSPQAEGWLRVVMCELAVMGRGGLGVCTIDIDEGFGHSVDTLSALRRIYPDVEFTFLVGDDIDLSEWKDFGRCAQLARFVRVARVGVPAVHDDLPRVALGVGEHSSSAVREALGVGGRAGVASLVGEFIATQDLYGYCMIG